MDSLIYGANWYVDTLNQRLRLATVKLPNLARANEEIKLAGGWMAISHPGEISPLGVSFTLQGAHEDIRSLFGREAGDWTTFYYYERLRDIRKGINKGRIVTLKGLLSDVTQPNVSGRNGGQTEYQVGTLIGYRDVVDGKRVHEFDFFSNSLIINGTDYSAEHNRLIAA